MRLKRYLEDNFDKSEIILFGCWGFTILLGIVSIVLGILLRVYILKFLISLVH